MIRADSEECTLYDEVIKKYNYKVYDVIPIRKVFILFTDKGNKVLKQINYDIKHLDFISKAMEYLKKNKFSNVIEYEKNIYGNYYTKHNNKYYIVMNLIEGRECEFNNPIELKMVAASLAKMHNASEGFRYDNNGYRYNPGTLIGNFTIKKEEIKIFKSLVSKYEKKSEFDKIFLENVDYNLKRMDESIKLLNEYQYLKACSWEDKIVLCHNDLVYHNMIIKDNEIHFIDFDYAVIDLRVHDLCNLINKVLKNFAFNFKKAKYLITEYNKFYNLEEIDFQMLYGMLVFPQDFYSIVKDYYKRKKMWEEETFTLRLKRKVSYKEEREEFLKDFKIHYNL